MSRPSADRYTQPSGRASRNVDASEWAPAIGPEPRLVHNEEMRSWPRIPIATVAAMLAVAVGAGMAPGGGAGAETPGRAVRAAGPRRRGPLRRPRAGAVPHRPRRGPLRTGGKARAAVRHRPLLPAWGEAFPDGREAADIAAGRIPMISWGKTSTARSTPAPTTPRSGPGPRGIRDLGQPVIVRWFWEMGGNRNLGPPPASPADYIAAWRRIHALHRGGRHQRRLGVVPRRLRLRRRAGAVVLPRRRRRRLDLRRRLQLPPPVPPAAPRPAASRTPSAAFYDWAEDRPKPIMIGEYGVVEDGPGVKAAWIDAARDALAERFPEIAAVVYFHSLRERDGFPYDWRMDTSAESLAAFPAMGADPCFNPAVEITLPETSLDSGPDGLVAARHRRVRLLRPPAAAAARRLRLPHRRRRLHRLRLAPALREPGRRRPPLRGPGPGRRRPPRPHPRQAGLDDRRHRSGRHRGRPRRRRHRRRPGHRGERDLLRGCPRRHHPTRLGR